MCLKTYIYSPKDRVRGQETERERGRIKKTRGEAERAGSKHSSTAIFMYSIAKKSRGCKLRTNRNNTLARRGETGENNGGDKEGGGRRAGGRRERTRDNDGEIHGRCDLCLHPFYSATFLSAAACSVLLLCSVFREPQSPELYSESCYVAGEKATRRRGGLF